MNTSLPEDLSRLRDMLEFARRVEQLVTGISRAEFDGSENLQTTVIHNLQIIGEAATKVSATFKAEHSEIAWTQITAMRHKIVHQYRTVNLDTIWRTATQRLPQLITTLTHLLS